MLSIALTIELLQESDQVIHTERALETVNNFLNVKFSKCEK